MLPLGVDDGLRMTAITPDHRMVLNRMFFHDVQEFQVGGGHMRASAVVDAGPQGDFRRSNPRFQGTNFERNMGIVERVRELAEDQGATPAQLALAWVHQRGEDIVPIPGTKRRRYLEENVAATEISLSEEDLRRLDEAAPPGATAGDRYPDMSSVEI